MKRFIGTVSKQSTPGFWLVKDKSGRIVVGASALQWRGGDSVVVVEGQIVGKAGKVANPKIFEV